MAKHLCIVKRQVEPAPGIFRMELDAPRLARSVRPGQFVHIRVSEGWDPPWRRPFSVHRVSKNGAGIEVLYRRIGRGTEMLSRKTNGETLDVLGPLGRGFDLGGTFRTALIVAGGLGIAPVLLLIDRLIKRGKRVLLLWGVRKAAEITVLETLPKRGVRIHLATEDGSEGFRGRVTDLLGKFLPESGSLASPRGFACGPMPMLRTLQPVALNTGFGWQASLEERMACGVGVCQGCMVRLRGLGYKTVCADGPVFNLMELDIDG